MGIYGLIENSRMSANNAIYPGASRGGGTWGTSPPPPARGWVKFLLFFGCLWGYLRVEIVKNFAPNGAFLVKAKNIPVLPRARAKNSRYFKVLTKNNKGGTLSSFSRAGWHFATKGGPLVFLPSSLPQNLVTERPCYPFSIF